MYPRREEFQWRPSSILCKRFDLIDPYMGEPPPGPRIKSKMDSLIFLPDSVKATKLEESVARDPYSAPQFDAHEVSKGVTDEEIEVEVENVERPVDLYKPIFSDDEVEALNLSKVEDPEKNIAVANTALNHLIAGDFLESLGKELGLEVPPELPHSSKATANAPQKEDTVANSGNANIMKPCSAPNASVRETSTDRGVRRQQGTAQEDEYNKTEFTPSKPLNSDGKYIETGLSEYRTGKFSWERMKEDAKAKSPSDHHRCQSSNSSSEDATIRKQSRCHRYGSDSNSDLSSDYQDRHHSRSNGRKKGSSREKSSSRSKHHKRVGRDSSSKSRYSTEKEYAEGKKEKRKRRD